MGSSDHVGIVVSVSGGVVKVIEGNKGNAVGYRDIAVNGKYIRGYGLPDYASKATVDKPAAPWYAEVQTWVKAMGISDGTRPEDTCTRAEQWAMAHNLYKAIKAGK